MFIVMAARSLFDSRGEVEEMSESVKRRNYDEVFCLGSCLLVYKSIYATPSLKRGREEEPRDW